ncbi:acyl transferase [Ekhidna sp.]|uniref:LuxE/PaaK family acyltransferase n=1 Tax=Ekhidna sp. TaxID=2608089 RepID=UPI003512C4B1
MSFTEDFKQSILKINEETFLDSSLQAFNFQYKNCGVYNRYCNYLNINPDSIINLEDIPFLPIQFFKNHAIKSGSWSEEKIFKSSGTTATGRSQHFIKDLDHYHDTAKVAIEEIIGDLSEYQIIAILPSYQEQGDSSLISMVDHFIKYASEGSGYYLRNNDLASVLESSRQKLVIGVSYALLDIASSGIKAKNAIIMETGGMKGRRKEMTREELHNELCDGFSVDEIWSEYGMTELQSQSYGTSGKFKFPAWAKCLIRDINDPFSYLSHSKTGGINVIDLANIDSCCFIETKDLGRLNDDYFEVLGRFDNSDIRGCNLMI